MVQEVRIVLTRDRMMVVLEEVVDLHMVVRLGTDQDLEEVVARLGMDLDLEEVVVPDMVVHLGMDQEVGFQLVVRLGMDLEEWVVGFPMMGSLVDDFLLHHCELYRLGFFRSRSLHRGSVVCSPFPSRRTADRSFSVVGYGSS